MTLTTLKAATAILGFGLITTQAAAAGCGALPDHAALTTALQASTATTSETTNGGLELNMWASIVDRDGVVCAVTMTGSDRGDQWPGSRVISALWPHMAMQRLTAPRAMQWSARSRVA